MGFHVVYAGELGGVGVLAWINTALWMIFRPSFRVCTMKWLVSAAFDMDVRDPK